MKISAVYKNGSIQLDQSIHLRHDNVKVTIDIPDEEIMSEKNSTEKELNTKLREMTSKSPVLQKIWGENPTAAPSVNDDEVAIRMQAFAMLRQS